MIATRHVSVAAIAGAVVAAIAAIATSVHLLHSVAVVLDVALFESVCPSELIPHVGAFLANELSGLHQHVASSLIHIVSTIVVG